MIIISSITYKVTSAVSPANAPDGIDVIRFECRSLPGEIIIASITYKVTSAVSPVNAPDGIDVIRFEYRSLPGETIIVSRADIQVHKRRQPCECAGWD